MEFVLTKDANKMICCVYKAFLERRDAGNIKREARRFASDYFSIDKILSKWTESDCNDTLIELAGQGLLKVYIGGNFEMTDLGIAYMESRFKNSVKEVISFLAQLIP